uniref:Uncharacterized protein n=1 Tax=Anguilla anguilla TaxID=7936 RepID=A0A0E9T090_ANGAN
MENKDILHFADFLHRYHACLIHSQTKVKNCLIKYRRA